jgi:hypothetical protein
MRAAVVGIAILATAVALGAQGRGLSRAELDAAIALGERGDPKPYLLRHAGRVDNPVVVGLVYTPFVRVALMARTAADRGERLDPEQIDPQLTAPLVYLAFRWYCCDPADTRAGALAAVAPEVVMLPLAERAPQYVRFTTSERQGAARPVWVRRGADALSPFEAIPRFSDIALVAAFPVEVLQPRRPFAIFKQFAGAQSIRTGVVRADEAAAWR